jgi:hypothetical protein
VEKALQTKLASLIKRMDKSLGKHAPGTGMAPEVHDATAKLQHCPHAI